MKGVKDSGWIPCQLKSTVARCTESSALDKTKVAALAEFQKAPTLVSQLIVDISRLGQSIP